MGELAATLDHDGTTYAADMVYINKTMLGREDHGIFTAMLDVDLSGGSSTHLGGFTLDDVPPGSGQRRLGSAEGMEWIIRVIEAIVGEYGTWESLAGKRCLALYEPDVGKYSRAGHNCKGIASVDGKRVVVFDDIWRKETADATG